MCVFARGLLHHLFTRVYLTGDSDALPDSLEPHRAAPLLLGPSLGTSTCLWRPQLAALAEGHRVVRWDLPGHGGSPAGLLAGEHTVDAMGRAVLRPADALGLPRFRYPGVSVGGAVGLWLAVHHPERILSLALVCSSARFGPPEPWHERAALVRGRTWSARPR